MFMPPPMPPHQKTAWNFQQQRWQPTRQAVGNITQRPLCPNQNIPAPNNNRVTCYPPPYPNPNYPHQVMHDPSLIYGYLRQSTSNLFHTIIGDLTYLLDLAGYLS